MGATLQTDNASDRVTSHEVPNIVIAEVVAGQLVVYKSVVVDDNDEIMAPVWEMAGGPLTQVYSGLCPDDTMLFGEAIGRVFKIG